LADAPAKLSTTDEKTLAEALGKGKMQLDAKHVLLRSHRSR
jgi:hypothetical protein